MNRDKVKSMKSVHNYDDIIDLPHPDPKRHTRMSTQARAAQFMPFAALTGYSAVIDDVSRTTDKKLQLDDSVISSINKKLRYLKNRINDVDVRISHFKKDPKKEGGNYVISEGRIAKIDEYTGRLLMEDHTVIAFDDILSIDIDK